jgi:hypothetical protein
MNLAKVEDESLDKKTLNGWLASAITRTEDRALFDLDGRSVMRFGVPPIEQTTLVQDDVRHRDGATGSRTSASAIPRGHLLLLSRGILSDRNIMSSWSLLNSWIPTDRACIEIATGRRQLLLPPAVLIVAGHATI